MSDLAVRAGQPSWPLWPRTRHASLVWVKLDRIVHEEFGIERVINTPISEAAVCGAAIGAAQAGLRCHQGAADVHLAVPLAGGLPGQQAPASSITCPI